VPFEQFRDENSRAGRVRFTTRPRARMALASLEFAAMPGRWRRGYWPPTSCDDLSKLLRVSVLLESDHF
jgi:hypothetical protein